MIKNIGLNNYYNMDHTCFNFNDKINMNNTINNINNNRTMININEKNTPNSNVLNHLLSLIVKKKYHPYFIQNLLLD